MLVLVLVVVVVVVAADFSYIINTYKLKHTHCNTKKKQKSQKKERNKNLNPHRGKTTPLLFFPLVHSIGRHIVSGALNNVSSVKVSRVTMAGSRDLPSFPSCLN